MQKTDLAMVTKYGKMFGYFTGPTPTLFTTDPELIRAIFVKDFECFGDKRPVDQAFQKLMVCLTIRKHQTFLGNFRSKI